jgi:dihydroflavonol-4-reductase
MRQVLVTGGTGFIGANLVEGLNTEGFHVKVLHRKTSSLAALEGLDFESVIGDVLDDPSQLAPPMTGCEWVFHSAAVSDYWRHGSEWLYQVNVEGTKNVLAAAQLAGVERFVFTSSLAAMGLPRPGRLLDESDHFNLRPGRFPYAHSKHLAELEVKRAAANGLDAVTVNLPMVLGPRDVNEVSGSWVAEAARGRLRILFPGGVNFVAVEDVVYGHLAAARKGRERYILAGTNISYGDAIPIICRIVERPRPRLMIPSRLLPLGAAAVSLARFFFGNRIPVDENQVRLSRFKVYASGEKAVRELGLPHTPFESPCSELMTGT